jgi:hypothetical protein
MVNFHVEGVAVGDVAAEEVLVFESSAAEATNPYFVRPTPEA